MDILLATINAKWVHPSLALRLLRANLGSLEERSAIVEWQLRQPQSERLAAVAAAAPRVLALSVSIWNHQATLELLRALAGTDSPGRPIVVLGGPEASHLPPDAELFAYGDYLLRGEGETAFADLCRHLLEGAARPDGWTWIAGSAAADQAAADGAGYWVLDAPPVDPAAIDPGYRLYTDADLARKLTYVEASRGCPFGCDFCLSALDRRVREFPLAAFLAELDGLWARGARSFKFLDRTFNLDAGRASAVMDWFLDRFGRAPDSGAYVHFEMVPSRFPPELRGRLRRFPAGTLRLEVGVQTLNPTVATTIGRACDPEADLEALIFLRRETAAVVHADLIVGLPGETLESFGAGFDALWAARPAEVQVGMLKRLPGTPLARHDAAFAMDYAAAPPYEVRSTGALSAADAARLRRFARFWELVVNRGKFGSETAAFLAEGRPVFGRFLELSDALGARLGRDWGLDREMLRTALLEEISRIDP